MQPKTIDKNGVNQVQVKKQKSDNEKGNLGNEINSHNQGLKDGTQQGESPPELKKPKQLNDRQEYNQQKKGQKSKDQKPENNQTKKPTQQNNVYNNNNIQDLKNQLKSSSAQKTQQKKQFHLQFQNYTLTFSLSNSTLSITGEQQLNRNYLNENFTYQKFTQQMKALFESVDDLWSILQSSKQNIQFQDKNLYFKIKLGGKDKKINIPLIQKQYTDPEYIEKIEQVAKKYMQLSKRYQKQFQINKKVTKIDVKGLQLKKHFTKPTEFILDSQRSHASSQNWPQPPANFNFQQQQTDDPIVQIQKLLQRLNQMRDEFTLLCEQVETKIKNKSDPKLIKVKLLSLQQRKKSFQLQLEIQKIKFSEYECKNDIYHEIDDLVKFLKMKYTELESKNNNKQNVEMIK